MPFSCGNFLGESSNAFEPTPITRNTMPEVQQQVWHVPVLPYELRQEQALSLCLSALQYLESATAEVFDRIDSRVSEERSKIGDLSSRIATAKVKVDAVSREEGRATRVMSPAKYPASKVLPRWKHVYQDLTSVDFTPQGIVSDPSGAEPAPSDPREPIWLMQRTIRRQAAKVDRDGLGCLPANLRSVSSLLLYNTNKMPYKKLEKHDNLAGRSGKNKDTQVVPMGCGPCIAYAPASVHSLRGMACVALPIA